MNVSAAIPRLCGCGIAIGRRREPTEIRDHQIGALRQEGGGLIRPVDSNHESESSAAPRLDSGQRVFNDHRLRRRNAQAPDCLEKSRWIRLPFEAQPSAFLPIHTDIKER